MEAAEAHGGLLGKWLSVGCPVLLEKPLKELVGLIDKGNDSAVSHPFVEGPTSRAAPLFDGLDEGLDLLMGTDFVL